MCRTINYVAFLLEELQYRFPESHQEMRLVIPEEVFNDEDGTGPYRECSLLTPSGEEVDIISVDENLLQQLQNQGILKL